MSREEEYKQKCRQVKDYYLEEICEHEDAGCLGDAENARKWRRAELEELDRQTSMWCSRRMWTSGRLTTPSPRFGWSCRGTWMQTPSMRCRIG